MMRSMIIAFSDDTACKYLDQQYMLGDNLCIVPVMNEEGIAEFYVFLFLSLLPQGRMPLGFLAEERTPHDCTTFSRRRGLPAPGSAALSAAAGRPQLHRFPRRRRHRSATFPRGEQTAIPLSSRRRMNRLSTAIDFVDNNMPEIYLIYISCRTIFATATRINNTNI